MQFVQVLFSLELFLLFPFMRRYIKQASEAAHVVTTTAMVITAAALLLPLSRYLAGLFLGSIVFVCLICPKWLVGIHKFKAKINGPWDEAVPHIPMELDLSSLSASAGLWQTDPDQPSSTVK